MSRKSIFITPKTNRGEEWALFAADVLGHVENYTVPQYGDAPDDQASEWGPDEIKAQLQRYVNRIGKGARGQEEARRDCLKIAHYACLLAGKLVAQAESRGEEVAR